MANLSIINNVTFSTKSPLSALLFVLSVSLETIRRFEDIKYRVLLNAFYKKALRVFKNFLQGIFSLAVHFVGTLGWHHLAESNFQKRPIKLKFWKNCQEKIPFTNVQSSRTPPNFTFAGPVLNCQWILSHFDPLILMKQVQMA